MRRTNGGGGMRWSLLMFLVAVAGCSSQRAPDAQQVEADARRALDGQVSLFGIPVAPSLYEVEIVSIEPALQVQEAPPTYEVRVQTFAVLTDPAAIGRIDISSLSDVMAMQNWVRGGGWLLQPGDSVSYEVVLLYQDTGDGPKRVRSGVTQGEGITRRPIPSSTATPERAPAQPAPSAAAPSPTDPPPTRIPTPDAPLLAPPTPTPTQGIPIAPRAAQTVPETAVATALPRREPSFDCTQASTPIERAICADDTLAALDADLGEVYAAARQRASESDRERLRAEQRVWIRERARRCGDPVDLACLRAALTERRDALRSAGSESRSETLDRLLIVTKLDGRVPVAPPRTPIAPLCSDELRKPESREEQSLADAGWLLLRAPTPAGEHLVFIATGDLDGSCRPLAEAIFAFARGELLARIEPADPANARLRTLTASADGKVSVTLDLWAPEDARCCPSSEARHEIDLGRISAGG